jgi:hypothetical protein
MQTRLLLSALVLALAGTTACVGYSYRPEPVAKALIGELPNPLRLTRLDGTRVTLHNPQLAGDTLVGWNEPEHTARFTRYIVRVPVAQILHWRVRQVSPGRTLLIWFGPPLGLALVGGIVCSVTGSDCTIHVF